MRKRAPSPKSLLRERIAEAKAIPARTERQGQKFVRKLAQIGALIVLYEPQFFGRITPAKKAKEKA